MDERRAKGFYESGKRALKKAKYQKALDLFDQSLSLNPEFIDSLNEKGAILMLLGRLEEAIQLLSKANLLKLQKTGDMPSDINSVDAWIDGAKDLLKLGKGQRALNFLIQASHLSPIVDKEGGYGKHHNNSKLYYETALVFFNHLETYEPAMELFEKAINYDPKLTIPEEIKARYNLYAKNRSGVEIMMIYPMNLSNLRHIVPADDKILASTKALLKSSIPTISGSKVKIYSWQSHILITDNGIAFQGAKPICKLSEYYLPLTALVFQAKLGGYRIISKAAKSKADISIYFNIDPKTKSLKYIQDLKLVALMEKKQEELLRRTVINLKSLEVLPLYLPLYKDYIEKFEYVPKKVYKKVIKTLKKDKN